jgi:catechol 2,3-dioxygenase-like lactoylglutathione lyase family enzyme
VTINVLFAGVAVSHLDSALDWYERLLGGPPDMAPNEHERAWRLTDECWIYVLADAGRAGGSLLTVMVDDLDARLAGFAERGIEVDEIQTISERTRKAVISDPDGNEIGFGEVAS